ncbi:MAG: protein kinase [Gemmatimonadaceae bacterium]|nr:protein kinase [Gemmatimonadaceae bacterium]
MSAPARLIAALADRYRIERELGRGGMATVYVAEDLKHRRQVAIKVMRPELSASMGADRFLREVEIAAKLSHPNILPVYDSGEADGFLYYVMPLVEGESLPERMARDKQMPALEALRLAREVAEALAYAHARGIVHRDIKPANILLSAGHALVADFGIARAMESSGEALTQTGLAIGTPVYMSPEQATGATDIDGRTDIYALGCVLYEMLAGEPPFTGPTVQAILARSLTENPRPLDQTRTALPAAVNTTVMKALAKTAADRYSTGAEFVAALDAAEDQVRTPSGEVVAATPARGVRPWQLAIAALVLLAAGVAGSKLLGGKGGAAASTEEKTLAVLPFENQGTADDAYFADGLVDELRDKLSHVPKLTVTASASADQYRASPKTDMVIAKELRVDQVLRGKVRYANGADGTRQVRVATELVDGASGKVTWRDTFDAPMADAFTLQGQIATRVTGALGTVLGQAATDALASTLTKNPEAYDLYLKAQGVRIIGTGGARARATLLEQAVALDSNFTRAWGGLAMNLTQLYSDGARDAAVARRAKEALDRLVRLAPDSAVVHLVAANYYENVARDLPRARQETERALALDPKSIWALNTAAGFDLDDGNYQAMFEKLSKARQIDPRSIGVLNRLVQAQIYLGRTEEALVTSAELLALEPKGYDVIQWATFAHLSAGDLAGAQKVVADVLKRVPAVELITYFAGYQELAYVLGDKERELLFRMTPAAYDNDIAWWGQSLATAAYQQGDLKRAKAYADSSLAVAKQQSEAAPKDPQLRGLYAVSLAYVGRGAEANKEMTQAVADAPKGSGLNETYVRLQAIRMHLALGEQDAALDGIEDILTRQSFVTRGYLKSDPMFAPLKNNERFKRIVSGGMDRPRG